MKQLRAFAVSVICSAAFLFQAFTPGPVAPGTGEITIAQLSDTHMGEKHSPDAADHLRQAVEMINAGHPDAVIVSGDLGESTENREKVKTILKGLAAPVYYVPGNHDVVSTNSLERYRKQFGPDYYRFQVKNVEVLALDSELLGNYEKFGPNELPPLPPEMEAESQKMLAWLDEQAGPTKGKTVIAVQHIPLFRDSGFPNAKPYWIVNGSYAQRETELLHKLGVKHLLAGHWHNGRVFEQDGITVHVAPATSWLPLGGQLGFAMHTITPDGSVRTDFVPLATGTH
jgi:3',5'-cyclic AMP phosphodiesterase CpdA